MKKYLAIALIFLSSSALAGGSFDGINIETTSGFGAVTNDNQWTGFYQPSSTTPFTAISLGYSRRVHSRVALGGEIFQTNGNLRAGWGNTAVSEDALRLGSISGALIEPGFYVSPNVLLFGKVGWAEASSTYRGETNVNYGKSSGMVLGLGAKAKISENLHVGFDLYQITFGRSASHYDPVNNTNTFNQPRATLGGFTVGYNYGKRAEPPIVAAPRSKGFFAQYGGGVSARESHAYWEGDTYKNGDSSGGTMMSFGYSAPFKNGANAAVSVFHLRNGGSSGIYNDDQQYRVKNVWGLSAEPGYNFTDNSLGYLKIGIASARSSYTDSDTEVDYGSSIGLMYGFGFRQHVGDNFYVGFESMQIKFGHSKTTYSDYWDMYTSNKPAITYNGFVIGYTF